MDESSEKKSEENDSLINKLLEMVSERRKGYYERVFTEIANGYSKSWNWNAFVLGLFQQETFQLAYHKMYKQILFLQLKYFIFLFLIFVFPSIYSYVFVIFFLFIPILWGLYFNRLLLFSLKKKLELGYWVKSGYVPLDTKSNFYFFIPIWGTLAKILVRSNKNPTHNVKKIVIVILASFAVFLFSIIRTCIKDRKQAKKNLLSVKSEKS